MHEIRISFPVARASVNQFVRLSRVLTVQKRLNGSWSCLERRGTQKHKTGIPISPTDSMPPFAKLLWQIVVIYFDELLFIISVNSKLCMRNRCQLLLSRITGFCTGLCITCWGEGRYPASLLLRLTHFKRLKPFGYFYHLVTINDLVSSSAL